MPKGCFAGLTGLLSSWNSKTGSPNQRSENAPMLELRELRGFQRTIRSQSILGHAYFGPRRGKQILLPS
jgi:hypothetical protein